ncbi:nuclear transport factor 2 family protein [Streptomyces sp. SID3343]|uniref:nuclear transport factor 2 family protein n=1 Tax=Streptomyces sp. SID3343 TaxID=2690260 RepID=UPI00137126B8|nr:nuclear transport factor 2 family protein [Streptomyces sp. SID3343]MYW04317.1 nuclear transport factor 2 family protein [Streptomyces sp. SID3343]
MTVGIAAALDALFFDRTSAVEEAVSAHFTDDYRQCTDGVWSDRGEFVQHVRFMRDGLVGGRVDVHEELRDGDRYAARLTVHGVKADGSAFATAVYSFAELADDGRFRRIREVTTLLQGSPDDAHLASAR